MKLLWRFRSKLGGEVTGRGEGGRAKLNDRRGLTGKRPGTTEKVERRAPKPDKTDKGVSDAAAAAGTDKPAKPAPKKKAKKSAAKDAGSPDVKSEKKAKKKGASENAE